MLDDRPVKLCEVILIARREFEIPVPLLVQLRKQGRTTRLQSRKDVRELGLLYDGVILWVLA